MKIHPEYIRAQRKLTLIGWGFIAVGIVGLALPFAPGTIPIAFGVSLLSFESRFVHRLSARFRMRHPKVAESVKEFETAWIRTLRLSTHTHEYVHIPSRTGGTMGGLVEVSTCNAGVAVILHSTSGTLETGVQNVLAEICRAQGQTVVRFDALHGLNEDGANFVDFTVTAYRTDLEDVLVWARAQTWWSGPLTLVGHSSGALVASLYASEHPTEVAELVLLTPTVSGQAYLDAFQATDPQSLRAWQEQRLRPVRHPISGEHLGLSYGFVEDLLRYDVMTHTETLTMPITIISGERDVTSPPEVCARLVEALGRNAVLLSVPGMHHTPEQYDELRHLASVLYRHIKS